MQGKDTKNTTFDQLFEAIFCKKYGALLKKLEVDKYVKKLMALKFIILIAFAQLEQLSCLREINISLHNKELADLWMNFPSSHPLCPGIDAVVGNSFDHYIEEADLLLLLDYNFPGPGAKDARPGAKAKVIHIDMEPLKKGGHLWGRKPDILMEGNTSKILPLLKDVVLQHVQALPDPRFRERFQRIANEHEESKESWVMKARNESGQRPISKEWLCRCINEILDDDTILTHMIPSSADALAHQIRRTKPGTIFSWGDNAGSMGWSLGAALGAKLPAPDNFVISLIGDGGFIYGCPIATLWSANVYNAPFLTVVFNNKSYKSIKKLMRNFHGEKSVAGELGFKAGVDFKNPPDYAAVAMACGAYGQTVEDPSELQSALKNAIKEVRGGRPAVLDVII